MGGRRATLNLLFSDPIPSTLYLSPLKVPNYMHIEKIPII